MRPGPGARRHWAGWSGFWSLGAWRPSSVSCHRNGRRTSRSTWRDSRPTSSARSAGWAPAWRSSASRTRAHFWSPRPGRRVDVQAALEGRQVVLFSLNSSIYGKLSAQLGTLAIQDLVTASGHRLDQAGDGVAHTSGAGWYRRVLSPGRGQRDRTARPRPGVPRQRVAGHPGAGRPRPCRPRPARPGPRRHRRQDRPPAGRPGLRPDDRPDGRHDQGLGADLPDRPGTVRSLRKPVVELAGPWSSSSSTPTRSSR